MNNITNKQFYPSNKYNAVFDWFTVLLEKTTNKLVVVVTENKFSTSILSSSNKVEEVHEDNIQKYNKTIKSFQAAGWDSNQIIFRLTSQISS